MQNNTVTTKSVTNHRSNRLDPETQRASLARRCPALKHWVQIGDINAIKLMRKMYSAGWSFTLVDGGPDARYPVGHEVLSVNADEILAYAQAGGAKLSEIYNHARRCPRITHRADALETVEDAIGLAKMYALYEAGLDEEADEIDKTIDEVKGTWMLYQVLSMANARLYPYDEAEIERAATVHSLTLEKDVKNNAPLCEEDKLAFILRAGGQIEQLTSNSDCVLEQIEDKATGESLYLISEKMDSNRAGCIDLAFAIEHFAFRCNHNIKTKLKRKLIKGYDPNNEDIPF